MKQVVQNYKTGVVSLKEVPVPHCSSHQLLVRNTRSLISMGTERATIALGQKSLLGKARARPDLVKRAIDKAKKEGIKKTIQEAMGRLDTPTPLGYSAAGVVVEVGHAATKFSPGDRVACMGQGVASHAEWICVPDSMACVIPENVSDDAAAFGMLGAIAMHGIRTADLKFGSTVVVMGLGLLGLLTVQILKAYGCHVIATDLVPSKVACASQLGADIAVMAGELWAYEDQADAVILTVASKSSDPIQQAIQLASFGGKLVLVGVADVHPDRNELWRKELTLVVSHAAGPIGGTGWTEQKNLAEFLRLLAQGLVQVDRLITHQFPIEQAESVYQNLLGNRLPNVVGVLFHYSNDPHIQRTISLPVASSISADHVRLSVIGAGVFGKALLLPALAKQDAIKLRTLVTATGVSAEHTARRFGFQNASTDAYATFSDAENDAILVLTPHRTHADFVMRALQQEKALWVEKPLCVHREELQAIRTTLQNMQSTPVIFVGHNRRFSPHASKMKAWLSQRQQPMTMLYRVNAGFIPKTHWVHHEEEGRSRILGEMSHFIDLLQYLSGEYPVHIQAERVAGDEYTVINNDNVVVTIKFSRGSVASLVYTASGHKASSREVIELFFDGKTIRSEDFRISVLSSHDKHQTFKTRGQSLGYAEALSHFIACVKGDESPEHLLNDVMHGMDALFSIEQALANGEVDACAASH